MKLLGYDRYVSQGGDWGSVVSEVLASMPPWTRPAGGRIHGSRSCGCVTSATGSSGPRTLGCSLGARYVADIARPGAVEIAVLAAALAGPRTALHSPSPPAMALLP
ncbi:hypothetical protein GCM10010464_58150 [Pseudonocardia yunnanensis]